MRKIIFISLLSFFIFHLSFVHGQAVNEIPVLSGEKWWGMFAGNSPVQPFGEVFEVNTAGLDGSGFYTGCLVSSAGRYIRSEEPVRVVFDGKKFTITSESTKVGAEKGGRTLRQAYLAMHHSDFKGTDKFPSPELFSNIVYETSADFGFLQTAEDILAYARRLLDEGYPAGIMVLADGWRDPAQSDFDRRSYPDPRAFVDEMHSLGFKVMLTVRPYMAAYGAAYARFNGSGLLVGDPQGAWTMHLPEGVCAVVDVRNQRTAAAIKEGLHSVMERYGIDGFRMDCLDFIEQYCVLYRDASPEKEAFLKAWHEIGADFALCEFMPGLPEYQTDCVSFICGNLNDVITAGLAAGPFTFIEYMKEMWGYPGESGEPDLHRVRTAAMQLMMPVAHVRFAPWKYDFAAAEMKRTLLFRAGLSKYMEKAYAESCKTVEPIVRPMEYIFAGDGFADCNDQYMLGDRYLIAPALDDNSKRLVRLPKGTWRDMNGKKHKGPLVLEAETDGYRMIWFELQ